ncbi:hypothetical protein AVEN_101623-1 [Araneus ventricosus]|uniref:Uncharacterized protein n=1 Tax=Araneus ventricosus TaxID=182803 RepID=A0A4Y2EXN2_ARAVE|nr:hypothetical protein AVEN_101623-1 [Araneus ventricosus]
MIENMIEKFFTIRRKLPPVTPLKCPTKVTSSHLVGSSYKVLPNDLYCPSLQSVLPARVCKCCGLYSASNVMLKKHIIGVHKTTGKCQPEVGRVRPLGIAARRQQELVAVITFTETVEFADWVDEDVIDIRGLTISEDESVVKMPVYSMNEHIYSPWKEES